MTTSMDRTARLRVVAGAALLVLSAPCLLLGLPGVLLAAALLVGGTLGPSCARAPVMLLCTVAFTTWWAWSWCFVDARLAPPEAALLLAAITFFTFAVAPLVLAPIAIATGAPSLADALARAASRHLAARGSVAIVTLAALAPPTLLSPLVGYLSGASALAFGLSLGIPNALRTHAAITSKLTRGATNGPAECAKAATNGPVTRAPQDSLEAKVTTHETIGSGAPMADAPATGLPTVALAVALLLAGLSAVGVLSLPMEPTPGPLGSAARAFDRPLREGPVLVTPHDEGFVVSVADGGGAGLVSTPFGRPDRASIDVGEPRGEHSLEHRAGALRVCVAREEASVCTWIDRDGVRLDDGPLDRASSAYGKTGLTLLACAATLLLALAMLGTRRRLVTPLALASTGVLLALALAPWC